MVSRYFVVVLISAGLAGCFADLNASSSHADVASNASISGVQAGGPSSPPPVPGPLLRLTASQYDNTVRDLLNDSSAPASGVLVDDRAGPFTSNAVAGVSPTVVSNLETLAQSVSQRATRDLNSLLSCDANRMAGDANYETGCVRAFITSFGLKAFRRPLSADETQDLSDLYSALRTSNTPSDATSGLVAAFLQNPFFLYRAEMLNVPQGRDYAVASRLSYFLWDSMPDATLLQAASSGNLHTASQVAAQVPRMLDDARALSTLHRFHREWLGVDALPTISKSAALYPQFTPAVVASMLGETDHFVDSVWNASGDTFSTLTTAPYTFIDGNLAGLYGVPTPTTNPNLFQQTAMPNRAGMLTQLGFLAVHAHEDQSDIVHRGLFVRTVLLCQTMPPPPNNVVIMVPAVDPNTSTRMRQDQHRANPACSGCHALMDPLGDGFEHYDAIGRYRQSDGPFKVDASGSIAQTDVDGKYTDSLDMMRILSQSSDVRKCYAEQWLRYALGRMDTTQDATTLAAVQTAFEQSGWNMRSLLAAVATSNAILTP